MTRQNVTLVAREHMISLDRPLLTPNERFWLEVIRLASWDSDPAPTLERVQRLRQIFQPPNSAIRPMASGEEV